VRAKAVVWLGARTQRFAELRAFLRLLTGVEPRIDEPGFAVFDLASGDRLEIFGEDDEAHDWMKAPVAGFLVDDVGAARRELEESGIEFIGPVHHADDGNSWSHFRAPDGHVYELTSQPEHPAHST
jgi:glyoxalase/bleomycin resistance protein/dioxygenase superfamily protein